MPEAGVPLVRLPDADSLFRVRAGRFALLASKPQSMAPYLAFMANVAEAQQAAVAAVSAEAGTVGSAKSAVDSLTAALHVKGGRLPDGWRTALEAIMGRYRAIGAHGEAVVRNIEKAAPEQLDAWGRSVLAAEYGSADPGTVAVIAAALQVVFTSMAAGLSGQDLRLEPGGVYCPVCGSLPVASLILASGAERGLRYLCCALCSTQWNLPRIRCLACGSVKAIAYYGVEGSDGAVKAEACDDCKAYLKILNLEKDIGSDALADDLASLPLDILMGERGYLRFGANPFLIPGAAGTALG